MSVDVFLDTNILVYAHDDLHMDKQRAARKILGDVWEGRVSAGISIQVLQEFYVTMLRKGGDPDDYGKVVEDYLFWPAVENTKGLMTRALQVHQEYKTSFYDANIIAAAQLVGAKELWSEDFNTGQDYGGVVAVNPFEEK